MTETIVNEAVRANPISPSRSGNMLIQLITPGEGSSAVYSPEVLEAAAGSEVFPAGTLMFADHPGETEAYDRPERSIRDVAAVLLEDARWDANTQALVAESRPFGPWREILSEMKDAIGVSIRARATVSDRPDPATGKPIVESLDEGISVDFVTEAGRGGAIREVYESARPAARLIVQETIEAEEAAPVDTPASTPSVAATPAAQSITHESKEDHMPQIEEGRLAQLEEAHRRVPTLESERDAAVERATNAEAQLAEAHREADAALAAQIVAEADYEFTPLERKGLMAQLPTTPEGRLDVESFRAAVATEAATAAEAAGTGSVRGLGGSTEPNDSADLTEAELDAQLAAISGRDIKEA